MGKFANIISVVAILAGVATIPLGGAVAMPSIASGLFVCVVSQLLFSNTKSKQEREMEKNKKFLNHSTCEQSEDPIEVYKNLEKLDKKVKFKGNHNVYVDEKKEDFIEKSNNDEFML